MRRAEFQPVMQRSFNDRVLGGVCAGLAAALRVNPWLVRVLFIVLSLVSGGAFAAAYLMLWWITPQQSAVLARRRLPLVFALLILLGAFLLWALNLSGQLVTADGVSLYLPVLAVGLAAIWFVRQFGGRTA
jgi:phage shock protein PspC (stress-responsive transcriptional regulator)